MHRKLLSLSIAAAIAITAITAVKAQTPAGPSIKLYVFDCGTIGSMRPESYGLKLEEIKGSIDFVTPCYLVVHPKGTMVWDVGQIPDSKFPTDGSPAKDRVFTSTRKLLPQIAAVGYKASDITYLAMSHYHTDHSANANYFAGSTWIVQEVERTAMFATPPPSQAAPDNYIQLKNSKTIVVKNQDHDVFGDGTVVIKFTPGHTPGHQSLFLKFAKAGPIVLAGDLYHYPEERTLDRVPSFDTDMNATRKSRKAIDDLVKEKGAQLWIEHDSALFATLAKPPQFIE